MGSLGAARVLSLTLFAFFALRGFDEVSIVGRIPKTEKSETVHTKKKEPEGSLISSRVGRSGGDGNALETYDVVEICSQNPPARRKPLCPMKWSIRESNPCPNRIVVP